MKGIVQAVKRRMHKEDKQESRSWQSSGAGTTVGGAPQRQASNGSTFRRSSAQSSADRANSPTAASLAAGGVAGESASSPVGTGASPKVELSSSLNSLDSAGISAAAASTATATGAGGGVGGSPTSQVLPSSPTVSSPSRQQHTPANASPTLVASSNTAAVGRSRLSSGGDSVPETDTFVLSRGGAAGASPSSGGIMSGASETFPVTAPAGGKQPARGALGAAGGPGSANLASDGVTSPSHSVVSIGRRMSPTLSPSASGSGLSTATNNSIHPRDSSVFSGSGIVFPPGIAFDSNPFEELPTLRETPQQKRLELFRKKLHVCSIVFDFNMPNVYQKEKEIKRQCLCEIVEYVNNARSCFNEQIMADVVAMVTANIFRALPPSGSSTSSVTLMYEPEEDEPALERAWPHLQVVYEFLLRFVVSHDTDAKIAKRYIEQNFVLKLLELFHSEDPRERDYLKTVLHRIYGKIMAMRSFIRKAIQHVFFKSIYEKEVQHGIAELLEILGSIVNGFALPLKEEHKVFLEKSLIPLHKARNLPSYHQYLAYCMSQYVEKDNRLAETIIIGLLKYWPATNTSKEVVFVNEVEEILELTQMAEFQQIMEPLFKKMAQCIQSPHFQVAERVLFLWNNDHIVKMINHNRHDLFPVIIGALYKNSKEHWNATVHGLTYNVSKLLAQADPMLFDDCSEKNATREEEKCEQDQERHRRWQELQSAYDSKYRGEGGSVDGGRRGAAVGAD